jgi:hypothetical protein
MVAMRKGNYKYDASYILSASRAANKTLFGWQNNASSLTGNSLAAFHGYY